MLNNRIVFVLAFSVLQYFPAFSQTEGDSLQALYYKKVRLKGLWKAGLVGGIIGFPIGEFESEKANINYAIGAAILLYPVTHLILRKTRQKVARQLGVSEETTRKWDFEYQDWKRQKRKEKKENRKARGSP